KTKKNPQCVSLSKPGKNIDEWDTLLKFILHMIKINKAHKIAGP
ncbi:MAG: hypothetical protein JWQ06_2399, partial [Mucilaginibacter sp.]|nr:hypothetical protein [Mucilaginibacter sp.]